MTFKEFLNEQFDRALAEGWSGKWLQQSLADSYEEWKAQAQASFEDACRADRPPARKLQDADRLGE